MIKDAKLLPPWKWHWRTSTEIGEKPDCGVYAEHHEGHAYAIARCPRYVKKEEWETIASFIVKSANCHDELVAALRESLAFAENELESREASFSDTSDDEAERHSLADNRRVVQLLRHAVARAEQPS